jgi:hypothetical protein
LRIAQEPSLLAASGVVGGHKAAGLYDQPLADEPLCVIAQLLQLSVKRLKVLLANEYSPFDLGPDQRGQRDIVGTKAALGHPYRPVGGRPNRVAHSVGPTSGTSDEIF